MSASYSLADVAKHTTKDDCWVVLHGKVLNVTSFLKDHPGGELAILTFAGKDATAEFDMIHPPDVVSKYAPECVIGAIGGGGAALVEEKPAAAAAEGTLTAGSKLTEYHLWGDWREEAYGNPPSAFSFISFRGWFTAIFCMVMAFMAELVKTIFSAKNFQFTNERTGLTRSAFFMIFFIVVHAIGNLHIFAGPNDFNGYGFFYVRLYWTGFGIVEANIIEEYVALCALLHALIGLKRTWDINITQTLTSGKLNLAVSGVTLLAFMILHLQQFRLAETSYYCVRPPPHYVNLDLKDLLHLRLFWTSNPSVKPVAVRDIYSLEYDLFQDPLWCVMYICAVLLFASHMILGWKKMIPAPALAIPRAHHRNIIKMGTWIGVIIAACYISFPIYTHFTEPSALVQEFTAKKLENGMWECVGAS
jgi:hypothetical protein